MSVGSSRTSQVQRPHITQFHYQNVSHFRKCCNNHISVLPPSRSFKSSSDGSSRFSGSRCASQKFSDSLEPDPAQNRVADSNQMVEKKASIMGILKQSNRFLPHLVLASTLLALVYPPSFTWFTTRLYAHTCSLLLVIITLMAAYPQDENLNFHIGFNEKGNHNHGDDSITSTGLYQKEITSPLNKKLSNQKKNKKKKIIMDKQRLLVKEEKHELREKKTGNCVH